MTRKVGLQSKIILKGEVVVITTGSANEQSYLFLLSVC
jgi:hypothetical protein